MIGNLKRWSIVVTFAILEMFSFLTGYEFIVSHIIKLVKVLKVYQTRVF